MRWAFIKDSAKWVVKTGAKTGNAIGDVTVDAAKDSGNWVVEAGAKTGNAIGNVTVDAANGTKKLTIKVGTGVVDVVAATGDLIGDALT